MSVSRQTPYGLAITEIPDSPTSVANVESPTGSRRRHVVTPPDLPTVLRMMRHKPALSDDTYLEIHFDDPQTEVPLLEVPEVPLPEVSEVPLPEEPKVPSSEASGVSLTEAF